MPDRTRPIRKEICLKEQELSMVRHKMNQLGTRNFGAYARKMLIDGYIIKVDYTEQKKLAAAASTIASRVSGRLSLFVRIISQRGQKRVAQLRTPLADLTENRHSSRITPDQRGCDEKSIST